MKELNASESLLWIFFVTVTSETENEKTNCFHIL